MINPSIGVYALKKYIQKRYMYPPILLAAPLHM